jgi:hypothetical protein
VNAVTEFEVGTALAQPHRMKTLLSLVVLAIVSSSTLAHAAEAFTPPAFGPVEELTAPVADSELSVSRSMADDFAREALQESADRPIFKQTLVVRTTDGQRQIFWMVKLAGSWKTAYVFANGDREGTTVIEDERGPEAPRVTVR